MTTETAAKIRTSLLESPYIGDVLQVTAGEAEDGSAIAGVRVTVANVPSIDALGPVVAEFRALVRDVIGDASCVYIEIAVEDPNTETVSTEKIVIRGAD